MTFYARARIENVGRGSIVHVMYVMYVKTRNTQVEFVRPIVIV